MLVRDLDASASQGEKTKNNKAASWSGVPAAAVFPLSFWKQCVNVLW